MLKVAIPNKGLLSEAASATLVAAGYRQRKDPRDLVLADNDNLVEFYYLRPKDISIYVGSGELDAGITGRDLLINSKAQAAEILALDFGQSTFRFAAPVGKKWQLSDLAGKRIATSYTELLSKYLSDANISATLVPLDGAVESAIRLGVADVIADVVSTGNTLRQAGLEVFGEPITKSEAILITRPGVKLDGSLDTLVRRVKGVVTARQYVLMDYDCPTAVLDKACAITPGFESPTISPLKKEGWVAVRSMVLKKDIHKVMDDLFNLGAKGILVTDIKACRL
jgi:ATP phosphoribosyltransferase